MYIRLQWALGVKIVRNNRNTVRAWGSILGTAGAAPRPAGAACCAWMAVPAVLTTGPSEGKTEAQREDQKAGSVAWAKRA